VFKFNGARFGCGPSSDFAPASLDQFNPIGRKKFVKHFRMIEITTVEICPLSDICRRSADCRASGQAVFAVWGNHVASLPVCSRYARQRTVAFVASAGMQVTPVRDRRLRRERSSWCSTSSWVRYPRHPRRRNKRAPRYSLSI